MSWVDKILSKLISRQILYQKRLLYRMIKIPKTTYGHACLNLEFRICRSKIEIFKALLPKK